jgi:flagellar hook-associated protein 2
VLSGGAITDAETIDIKLGNTTATYAAGAGESLADMATGLNAALAASGLALSASVSGNRLTVQANAYGTNGSFSIRSSATGAGQSGLVSSASAWESHPGVNVAGTIGGKTATGSGSVLNVATSDADIPGLSIAVTGTTTGDFGTITYAPGIAARLGLSALAATDAATGSITSAETGGKSTVTRYDKDIADWDRRLVERRARLKAQYATLDSTLGQLRNQSSWVSSQLSSLG